ncbi:unnamed protein product [Ambrosiozyma monospora]|uniref:Unnamed protein product n=1 Tax=Ambrosiozyma monospora TaxID=43982 RepID=A0ACB5T6M6_AMBMO|nr:unnamed protein product [Ambrosiozyma monospora]
MLKVNTFLLNRIEELVPPCLVYLVNKLAENVTAETTTISDAELFPTLNSSTQLPFSPPLTVSTITITIAVSRTTTTGYCNTREISYGLCLILSQRTIVGIYNLSK